MTRTETRHNHYLKVADAIRYMTEQVAEQPTLFAVAKEVHSSPFHFQKIFSEWAGVSPKKFLEFISVQHAKSLLLQPGSLRDVAYQTGLTDTQHLNRLFVKIEAMSAAEYAGGAQQLHISYWRFNTIFGQAVIATTAKGICFLAFGEIEENMLADLKAKFPHAKYTCGHTIHMQPAILWLQNPQAATQKIHLHVKGTAFQLNVWQALLNIPAGQLSTYAQVALTIENKNANRAVGTAIGSNPVAYIIPCHRVIQSTGVIGNYRWEPVRKKAMIGFESAVLFKTKDNISI